MFPGVNVYGAIALNNPIGGLNPTAIDIAARLGAGSAGCRPATRANEQANVAGQLDEIEAALLDEHRAGAARGRHRRRAG